MRRLVSVALAILLTAMAPAFAADITVFAAASLAETMNQLAADFSKQSGKSVAVSLAASSALAKQIESSAGADIFVSADEDWMDYLDKKALIAHDSRKNFLGNHLVLIAPAAANVSLTIAPHFDLLGALNGGR